MKSRPGYSNEEPRPRIPRQRVSNFPKQHTTTHVQDPNASRDFKYQTWKEDFETTLADKIETNPTGSKPESSIPFTELPLRSEVAEVVTKDFGLTTPTYIQTLMVNTLLTPQSKSRTNHIVCASETGSGKTLAYLIPLFHLLREFEEKETLAKKEEQMVDVVVDEDATISDVTRQSIKGEFNAFTASASSSTSDIVTELMSSTTLAIRDDKDGSKSSNVSYLMYRKPRQPRAVIIVPSKDLVNQVTQVAKKLSHVARLRVLGVTSSSFGSHSAAGYGGNGHVLEKLENSPVDILVMTPGIAMNMFQPGVSTQAFLTMRELQFVVIDEADTLFDKHFTQDLKPFIDAILDKNASLATTPKHQQNVFTQCMLVGATFPKTVDRKIEAIFTKDSLTKLATPKLHRVSPNVRHNFQFVRAGQNKHQVLLDILKRSVSDKRIMVFCNTRKNCELLEKFLIEKGYNAFKVTKDTDERVRKERVELFTSPPSASLGSNKQMILVSTDLASRGLDTLHVTEVINYEFPMTIIDFLHRIGRTGRTGKFGRATSIVAKKDTRLVEMVSQIYSQGAKKTSSGPSKHTRKPMGGNSKRGGRGHGNSSVKPRSNMRFLISK